MPKIKRLRVFAGPNGSGKSTLFEEFRRKFKPGFFINADAIEKELREKKFLDLGNFNLSLTQSDLGVFLEKPASISLIQKAQILGNEIVLEIRENILISHSSKSHSYSAALVSSFLREKLIKKGTSFSFETVMSHPGKINEILMAKDAGYKIYFYFICIDEPSLNVSRVENRVAKGGHAVSKDKILSRYESSLSNLLPILKVSDRAFLFDNSNQMLLVSEVEKGILTVKVDENQLPNWFFRYVLHHP